MKVLLALKPNADPENIRRYITSRFADLAIELQIVSVLASTQNTLSAQKAAIAQLRSLSSALRQCAPIELVRTQLLEGDPVDAINTAALRNRSDLVLILEGQSTGFLSRLGSSSITRKLCQQASYSVEVIKPRATDDDAPYRVLVPITEHELELYPINQLIDLHWPRGSCIRFLALLPPALDDAYAEMQSRLGKLCEAMNRALGQDIRVDYRLVYDCSTAAAVREANESRADLLVVSSQPTDSFFRGLKSVLSPAAMLMAAKCSVLMLNQSLPRNFGRANRVITMLSDATQQNSPTQ
jgi:nucleotide-binding universal stress UspA family protein